MREVNMLMSVCCFAVAAICLGSGKSDLAICLVLAAINFKIPFPGEKP